MIVWFLPREIEKHHMELKRHRWQIINADLLMTVTQQQLCDIQMLPDEASEWDVCQGLEHSILDIQVGG